jgi:hypothetical protein
MKTERRQELKQNELADWLARWIDKIRPYSRLISAVVIAALVGIGVVWYTQNQRQGAAEQASRTFLSKGVPQRFRGGGFLIEPDFDVLDQLAKDHADEPVGKWSLLSAGNIRLQRGVKKLFRNSPDAGKTDLENAIVYFQNLSGRAEEPFFKRRALWGLARANESLGTKDSLSKARENYQALVDQFPDSSLAEVAQQRVDRLEKESVVRFYRNLPTEITNNAAIAAAAPAGQPGFGDLDGAVPGPGGTGTIDQAMLKKMVDDMIRKQAAKKAVEESTEKKKEESTDPATALESDAKDADKKDDTKKAADKVPAKEPAAKTDKKKAPISPFGIPPESVEKNPPKPKEPNGDKGKGDEKKGDK